MLLRLCLSLMISVWISTSLGNDIKPQFRIYMTGGHAGAETFVPFLNDAGHGNIVVLKASGYAKNWYDKNLPRFGSVKKVETLIITDRSKSNKKKIYKKIVNADGLFIAGGNQFNYHKYWKGTLVEDAINEQLKKNTPVGGSSAGLAILGEFYYSANPDGDPIETDFIHTPLLKGVITDTHFTERNRHQRLEAFLRRIQEKYAVKARGIGVDEATTLIVEESGEACVSGKGSVWILEGGKTQKYSADECLTP